MPCSDAKTCAVSFIPAACSYCRNRSRAWRAFLASCTDVDVRKTVNYVISRIGQRLYYQWNRISYFHTTARIHKTRMILLKFVARKSLSCRKRRCSNIDSNKPTVCTALSGSVFDLLRYTNISTRKVCYYTVGLNLHCTVSYLHYAIYSV